MDSVELVNLASIFLDSSEKDDEDLINIVEGKGFKRELAERYVAFMPIAFGRVVIKQIADE